MSAMAGRRSGIYGEYLRRNSLKILDEGVEWS